MESSSTTQVSHTKTMALSLRANFSWTFAGNVVYAACQWGMLITLAKLGSPEIVGRFSLGLAITAPVIMLTNLQLRDIQATDARREYTFRDYLSLRLVMTVLGLLIIGAIVLAVGYSRETALVVLGIGIAKAFESMSDIIYGLLQQHERMDRIAVSLIIRGLLSLLLLSAAIALTGNIVWGVLALASAWAGVLVSYDLRSCTFILREEPFSQKRAAARSWDAPAPQKLLRLAWLALPLGVVMMLVSLNANIPRFYLERYLDERSLGIFSALAYLQVAGTTVVAALAGSAIPVLAKHYTNNDRTALIKLFAKLVGVALILGIGGCLVSLVAGRAILTVIYGPEYGADTTLFFWVMVTAMIGYVTWFVGDALTAIRQIRIQVPLFALTAVSTAVCCVWLIPPFGLLGAAAAMVIGSFVRLLGGVLILGHALYAHQPPFKGQVTHDESAE
jgi:O-antigen/teichoic acid export membrane protein